VAYYFQSTIILAPGVLIIPEIGFIDWKTDMFGDNQATTILIPDKYDEINYEIYLKKILKKLFGDQLGSWTTNIDDWPKKRDYKTFKKWFDVLCSDMTYDYGDGYIEHDDD